jgi:hypothetical protein
MDPELEQSKKLTVTIPVSRVIEKKLHALGAQAGQGVEKYLQQLIEGKALRENGPASARETYLDSEFLQSCTGEADESVTSGKSPASPGQDPGLDDRGFHCRTG